MELRNAGPPDNRDGDASLGLLPPLTPFLSQFPPSPACPFTVTEGTEDSGFCDDLCPPEAMEDAIWFFCSSLNDDDTLLPPFCVNDDIDDDVDDDTAAGWTTLPPMPPPFWNFCEREEMNSASFLRAETCEDRDNIWRSSLPLRRGVVVTLAWLEPSLPVEE
jgi:hypothetical protein